MALLKLEKRHIKPASQMLARAFKDELKDVFPDEEERNIKTPYVNEFYLLRDYAYGEALITSPRLEGIIFWIHSDIWKSRPFWRMLTSGAIRPALRIGFKALSKIQNQQAYIEEKHKELVSGKHCYLAVLAVDPQYQGKGYGSRLLNGMFACIDRDGLPCYVETEGEKNVSMYRHFGFEVIDEFAIPGSEDKLVAMLRQPVKTAEE